MRYRRRSVLTALAAGLAIALLPVAAEACGHDHRPGPGGGPAGGGPGGGAPVLEYTAVYVYQKLNPRQPASWENSGRQKIVLVKDGLGWVDRIDASLLPAEACGDGWAVQEDQIRGLTKEQIPQEVDRATNTGVLRAPTLVAWRHRDLSRYVDVPECNPVVPEVPVTPTPTATPTDRPTPPPPPERPTPPPPAPVPTPTPPVPPVTPTPTAPVTPPTTAPVPNPPVTTAPVAPVAPAAPAVPVVVAPTFAG